MHLTLWSIEQGMRAFSHASQDCHWKLVGCKRISYRIGSLASSSSSWSNITMSALLVFASWSQCCETPQAFFCPLRTIMSQAYTSWKHFYAYLAALTLSFEAVALIRTIQDWVVSSSELVLFNHCPSLILPLYLRIT